MSDKKAYTIPEAATAVGLSVTSIREAIDNGALKVKYPNRKPIIRSEDVEAWLDSMPDEKPTTR